MPVLAGGSWNETGANRSGDSSLKEKRDLILVPLVAALQVLLDQSTKANSPLKGHERTVQYLQRLGKQPQHQHQPPGLLQP